MPLAIAEFTAQSFQPYVGELLEFQPAEAKAGPMRAIALRLVSVTRPELSGLEGGPRETRGLRHPFSLLFEAPGDERPVSALYDLIHSDFERTGLFVNRVLVPGRESSAAGTAYYEIVFG